MPVKKFRSVEEMKAERWRNPGDSEHQRVLSELWNTYANTREPSLAPGVYKHRTIEEAKAAKGYR